MTAEQVRQRVQERWPEAKVEVTGEGCNFTLQVHCVEFGSLSRVQRQKLVYGLFTDEIASGAIHALTIRAEAA